MPGPLDIGKRAGMAFGAGLFTAAGQMLVSSASGTGTVRRSPSVIAYAGQQASVTVGTSLITMLDSTLTLPAVGFVAGDRIDIEVIYAITNNSGNARVYTVDWLLGSTTVASIDSTAGLGASATSKQCRATASILVTSLTAQRCWTEHNFANSSAAGKGYSEGGQSATTAAEDLSTSKAIDWKIKTANATATQSARVDRIIVTHIPYFAS